jgi:acylphosphatase
MTRRFEAIVHGVVQGVFFRRTTEAEACRLGLSGAVRNQPDGTVRVVAEGDEAALADLLAWLGHGPERAVVERIDVQWTEPRGVSGSFRAEE